MDSIIREYNNKDYDGLNRLLYSIYGVEVKESVLHEHYLGASKKIIVAIEQNKENVIGCAFVEEQIDYIRPNKTLYVTYVAVAESCQGQGVGRKIMNAIENMGKAKQCNAIEFTSADYRIGAHAFYTSLGYSRKKTTHFIKEIINNN